MLQSMRWFMSVAVMALALRAVMPAAVRAEEPAAKADQQALVREGAKRWPEYCGNCHNLRGPGEHSAAEWETIVQHMRVRANLPGQDAREILEYLKRRHYPRHRHQ